MLLTLHWHHRPGAHHLHTKVRLSQPSSLHAGVGMQIQLRWLAALSTETLFPHSSLTKSQAALARTFSNLQQQQPRSGGEAALWSLTSPFQDILSAAKTTSRYLAIHHGLLKGPPLSATRANPAINAAIE